MSSSSSLLAGQHQPRLQLQQRGDQHDELGRGLQVELAARLEVVEVGEHDVGELQLEQVDLFAQDSVSSRSKGPLKTSRSSSSVGERSSAAPYRSGPDAGRRAARRSRGAPTPIRSRTSASVSRGDRARALGAVREDRLERRLVGAQLAVALAHRRQVVDHRGGDGRLEVAVAGVRELRLDRLRRRRRGPRRGSRSGW